MMEPGKSRRTQLMARLALAIVFLAAIAVTSVWVVRSFIVEPKKTIVLSPEEAPVSKPPAAMASPGTPNKPAQARRAARPAVIAGPPIGGIVQNDAGQPIANARVTFNWRQTPGPNELRPGRQVYQRGQATTDSKGHWTSRAVPEASIGGLNFSITQKDYATTPGTAPAKDLLAKTATFVMNRGLDISGVVVNSNGDPVYGAQIALSINGNDNNTPTTKTDGSGKFTLRHVPPSDNAVVTSIMMGYAPAAAPVKTTAQPTTLRLVMTDGRTITGRVTDGSGQPVGGVAVEINTWQGIYRVGDNRATTDSDGKYQLRHMPADGFALEASKQDWTGGYEQVGADQNEMNFSMSKQITMHGTVVDAETRKPIDNFTVVTGVQWSGGQPPNFQGNTARAYTGGQYRQLLSGFSGSINSWYVRIEAHGYLPADSPPLHESGAQNFELKHGKDLIGHVLAADGKPVAGATVTAIGPGQQAYLRDGDLEEQGSARMTTDANGQFDMPPRTGTFLLMAVSAAGFGQTSMEGASGSPDVHLMEWGHIQGKLMIGPKPGANIMVSVEPPPQPYVRDAPRIFQQLNQQTDASGHFNFDRVPPGEVSVSRVIQTQTGPGRTMWQNTQTQHVTLAPGASVTVNLGGGGRPVVGRLIVPKELSDKPGWYFSSFISSNGNGQPPAMPEAIRNSPQIMQQIWFRAFLLTDAGKAYLAEQNKRRIAVRTYAPEIAEDRTFRIDDVEPGTYSISVLAQPEQGGRFLGQGVAQFTVPPIQGGSTPDPLQIPDITVNLQN